MKRTTLLFVSFVALVVLYFGGRMAVKKLSRGIKNNNPGNLRPMATKWNGELEPDRNKGGPFSRFSSPYYGWRAMATDVFGDIRNDGLNTIRKLVAEYAPAADNNDEEKYMEALEKSVGVSRDYPLNVYLHGSALIKGIATYENGLNPDLVWGSDDRKRGTKAGQLRIMGA